MVVEVALNDRLEPLARERSGIVHAFAKLQFDFRQLCSQAPSRCVPLHRKFPVSVLPADMREAQKIERVRLTFSPSFPILFGKLPELDQTRLVRMEFQAELKQGSFNSARKRSASDRY